MVSAADDDELFDASIPVLFQASCKGVGQRVLQIPGSLASAERFQKIEASCADFMASSNQPGSMQRVSPKGQPNDEFELFEWVPAAWKASKWLPEAVRGFGSPWLVVSKPGSFFTGPERTPCAGIGQFVMVRQGRCLLFAWSAKAALDRGASVASSWKFIFEEMASRPFSAWASEHMKWVTLEAGSAVWIPYGWMWGQVSKVSGQRLCSVLAIPYVTASLASRCNFFAKVSEFLQDWVSKQMEANSTTWKKYGGEFVEWLVSFSEVSHAITGCGQPAIMNGPEKAGQQVDDDANNKARDNQELQEVEASKVAKDSSMPEQVSTENGQP